MAFLQIHTFPDPILKQVAKPVEVFDAALRKTADDMLETMYASNGIGLAAIQVAILKRLVVVDLMSGSEDESQRDQSSGSDHQERFPRPHRALATELRCFHPDR